MNIEGKELHFIGKAMSRTYRLNQVYINIIEAEAIRTRRGYTDILKAALIAYASLNDKEKNHWLLESVKKY